MNFLLIARNRAETFEELNHIIDLPQVCWISIWIFVRTDNRVFLFTLALSFIIIFVLNFESPLLFIFYK